MIKLGNKEIQALKLGSKRVHRVYLGGPGNLLWEEQTKNLLLGTKDLDYILWEPNYGENWQHTKEVYGDCVVYACKCDGSDPYCGVKYKREVVVTEDSTLSFYAKVSTGTAKVKDLTHFALTQSGATTAAKFYKTAIDDTTQTISLKVSDTGVFALNDTVAFSGVTDNDDKPIAFTVTAIDIENSKLTLRPFNTAEDLDNGVLFIPPMNTATTIWKITAPECQNGQVTTSWKRFYIYLSQGERLTNDYVNAMIGFYGLAADTTIYIAGFKLEKGHNANSTWSISPDDTPPQWFKESIVCWYDTKRNGDTNESMAASPILKDLSGNGVDLQCLGFAWDKDSGINSDGTLSFYGNTNVCHTSNKPILSDFTVITRRVYRLNQSSIFASTASPSGGTDYGAFVMDYNDMTGRINRLKTFEAADWATSNFIGKGKNICVFSKDKYNGTEIQSGTGPDNPWLTIGCIRPTDGDGRFFKGYLWSFMLFNRTLTDNEVQWVINRYIE